jgi:hypothetical protein
MIKIPTLFVRGDNFKVIDQVTPGCEWVLKGEGTITEKLNGTNVMVVFHQDNRYTVCRRVNPTKEEKQQDIQPMNLPCDPLDKNHRYLIDAVGNFIADHGKLYGTIYGEAIGPKIQGNPYNLSDRIWIPFQPPFITNISARWSFPLTYEDINNFLKNRESEAYPGYAMEGLVFRTWWASAKIKAKDFSREG